MQLFGTKGQKFLHCPGTKGPAKNLAKGRDGPGQPVKILDGMRDGTVRDFDRLSHSVPWDKMGQNRKGCSKTGKGCSKTEKDVLKQERMF